MIKSEITNLDTQKIVNYLDDLMNNNEIKRDVDLLNDFNIFRNTETIVKKQAHNLEYIICNNSNLSTSNNFTTFNAKISIINKEKISVSVFFKRFSIVVIGFFYTNFAIMTFLSIRDDNPLWVLYISFMILAVFVFYKEARKFKRDIIESLQKFEI